MLRISGHEWKVLLTKEPIGGEVGAQTFTAQENETTNTIVIDGTLPKSRQEENLLHELIHLSEWTAPEYLVHNIGVNLYGYLKDNGLIGDNFLDSCVDGEVDQALMDMLNAQHDAKEEELAMVGSYKETVKPAVTSSETIGRGSHAGDLIHYEANPFNFREDGYTPAILEKTYLFKEHKSLPLRNPDGTANALLCRYASATFNGAYGGLIFLGGDRKRIRAGAEELARVYRDELHEDVPAHIAKLL